MSICQKCWNDSLDFDDYLVKVKSVTNHKDHTVWVNGDLAKFTGESEILHNALFHKAVLLQGYAKGKSILIRIRED